MERTTVIVKRRMTASSEETADFTSASFPGALPAESITTATEVGLKTIGPGEANLPASVFRVPGDDEGSMEIACDRHGSHQLWEMPKRWVERENIRTKEVYCPDDERLADPLATWTGSSWIPLPGRGVSAAWCREEAKEVDLQGLETVTREERKGPVTYAVCPTCGSDVAWRNRWKYWQPLYRPPEEPPLEAEGE